MKEGLQAVQIIMKSS